MLCNLGHFLVTANCKSNRPCKKIKHLTFSFRRYKVYAPIFYLNGFKLLQSCGKSPPPILSFSFHLFFVFMSHVKLTDQAEISVWMSPRNSKHVAQWSISRHSRDVQDIIWGFQLAVMCEVSNRQRGQMKRWGTRITARECA